VTWKPYGPDALLFEFAERADETAFLRARAIVAELERQPPPGLVEFVPGFVTLLLVFDPARRAALPSLGPALAKRFATVKAQQLSVPEVKTIPVTYDGPDLPRVAEANGLTVEQVVALHLTPTYRVHLLGFAPGFPYLGGLDARLHTPRHASPRPRVPAGSVAIGGEHTGIYPVASPGGWNLIGRTSVVLFDPARGQPGGEDAMFFLQPGDAVKFVPATA
jgi:inhibitor of KinA